MKAFPFRPKSILAAVVFFPLLTMGQTLTLTNGSSTYFALTNTTVTMTGRTELKVTAASNPIPGCLIHLNSSTAWLFLPNIRPATVISTYLGQVRVNGANAVTDSNVRVVPYAMGTVVIPQAPSFLPLQVFSGQNFLGASANFGTYTYYNTAAALGAMNRNISSFKLKRGYSATFAQNADGTGASKVFIAQDGDLEVGVMATNLERQCSFVRVFPWRWTGKKGWDDVAGENSLIKPLWYYDWGSGSTSSADSEYAPMQWGGGYSSGINSKQKSTHLLGFNEPDRPEQANMTVAQAVANWPSMMQSGLRLGAPGVSDSFGDGVGVDWLYSFITQIDALGYRVDYVPVHWYKCDQTAAQLYNYLLGVYQTTGRPVWLTEFNDGANWCGSPPPTYAQHATATQEMVDILESAPFVERYAIYNWVGDTRAMITNNALTPAGIIYRDKQSALGYVQALPSAGTRSIAQLQFDGDTLDSSGFGNNGFASGIPSYPSGHTGQALALDGTNLIQLPPNVANSDSFTFAAWVNWDGGANWQRIFDFGDDTSHYLFLTPSSSSGTLRFAIKNGGAEQIIETSGLPVDQWRHVAITLSGGSARLYTNGVLATSSSGFTIVPSNFNPNLNYLGKSQFSADPLFRGNLDEVQIADFAMTPAQIAALLTNSPPQFTTNLLARSSGTQGVAYNDDISGTATDPDPADTFTYSKAVGPAWLNVSVAGTLTGTPPAGVGGTNNFTVRVTDAAGASAFAMLTIYIVPVTVSGTWSADASGNWSDTNKWSAGFLANGASYTADFSTINITGDRTITLDSSRSIGALKFGDTAGAQNWILSSSGGSILNLDSGNSGSPTLSVTNTATVSAPLAGTNGFTKSGPGALVLSGTNTLAGSTRITEGSIRLANSNGLQNATVNLDGSDAGTLTFSGITMANVGGLRGSRNLALVNLSAAGVTLNVNSTGADSFAGILSGIGSLLKSGSGVLTLTSSNTYTGVGGTIVNGGTLKLARDPVAKFTFDSVGGGSVGSVVTNTGSGGAAMNAVVTSSSVSYAAGKFGNALSLTASGAYLKVPHKIVATDASGSWTVGFWVKTATAGAMIMYQGDGGWSSSGQTTYLLNANSGSTPGTRAGVVRWAGGFLTGTAVLNDNNWHFITLVDNAGTQSIYVDGNVDAVTSTMGLALAGNANQTWIGNAPDSDSGAIKMTGQIDDVYLFNRALSLTEVRSLTNTVPGLIAGNFGGQLPSSTALAIAAGATFDLGGNWQNVASLGDHSGGGGTLTNSGAAPVTLTLGGTSGTKTFSGVIADRAVTNAISLVKNGAATAILSGANSFRGTTTVNAGTLLVNGVLGTNTVMVNAGTLGGSGWIGGPVVVQPAAVLSPGASIGLLTCSNHLTLAGTAFVELDKSSSTNDLVQVNGTLNYGGTLTIVNLAGSLAAGDTFKIFNAPAYTGSFAATNLPALDPGLVWNFDAANGTLSIVQTVAVDSPDISSSFAGNTLTLSWPSDHIGWRLETNSVNISDTNFWFTLPGSDLTNQMFLTIDPASSNVFFRLTFP